jgi:hypothetical protein
MAAMVRQALAGRRLQDQHLLPLGFINLLRAKAELTVLLYLRQLQHS